MKLKVLLFIVFGFSFNLLFAFQYNNNDSLKFKDFYTSIDSLCELGHKYKDNGDFYQSDLYYNKSLFIIRNNNINDPATEGYLLHLIGNNYAFQKKHTKAIEYLKQATKLYSKKKYINYLGKLYSDIAYSYNELKQKDTALIYYKKAILLYEQEPEKYKYQLSTAYKSYGLICYNNKEFDKSEKLFLKSHNLTLEQCPDNTIVISNSLNYLGYFYKHTEQYKNGIEYFQKSIIAVIPEFTDTNIYSNPKAEHLVLNKELLYAIRYKANAFYLLYKQTGEMKNLMASFETFELTFALIDKSRNEFFSEESNLSFANNYKETVNNALKTIYELYKVSSNKKYLNKLFEYSEKGKASLLYKSMAELEAIKTDKTLAKLYSYDKKIKSAISIIQSKTNKGNYNYQQKRINNLMQKHDKLKMFTEQNYPLYKNRSCNNSTISLSNLQTKLQPNEVLLEYCMADTLLICFVIEQQSTQLIVNIIDSTFVENILDLRECVEQLNTSEQSFNKFTSASKKLHDLLIYPAREKIKNKKLIIVPDDKLLYIPFGVLIKSDKADVCDYKNLQYLIYNNAISYTYSASLKYMHNNKKRYNNNKLAAFAPDYLRLENIEETDKEYLKHKDLLKHIKYAKTETKYISEMFGGKNFVGDEASEHYFKQNAGKYNILHLAMHTSISDENPLLSKFFFTYTPDTIEDNCLNTYELYNMQLKASLVVLNGCNTGYGKLYSGEGLYNLARAFIHTGCPAIVLTLWDVNDYFGSQLISKFYNNINTGLQKDEALQNAKTDYLANTFFKDDAHPYYWSNYILIGNISPIKTKFNSYFYLKILFSIVILSFLVYFFFKYTSKNKKN